MKEGTVVQVKGTNNTYCKHGASYHYNYFESTADFSLSGNIMSLIYGTNFRNQTELPAESKYNFCSMFYNNSHLTSVNDLVMPATTLREECYAYMFEGCSKLVTAPTLPALTGATNCYKEMFKGCTYLKYIRVMLADPQNGAFTTDWLPTWTNEQIAAGEATQGIFFYNSSATTWPTGANGIPNGWTAIPLN